MELQAHTPVKKSRAQVLRDKVEIRLAVDEAGPLIAEVLKANGVTIPGATWDKVFPNWLIATVDDEVIGCVMVLAGKPVSLCEFLAVKPSVPFKLRAIAIRKLLIQSMATANAYGSTLMAGMVDRSNKKFADVLEHMGFAIGPEGRVMVKRVA